LPSAKQSSSNSNNGTKNIKLSSLQQQQRRSSSTSATPYVDDGQTLFVISGSNPYGQAVSKMLEELGVDIASENVRFMLGE
jgi:hypothetical protein